MNIIKNNILLVCFSVFVCVSLSSPSPTNIFSPSKSSSFNKQLFSSHPEWANTYADGSTITGYAGKDIIEWGGHSANVEFGCASAADTTGEWDGDGIIGLGLRDTSLKEGSTLSYPFFYYLCDWAVDFPCIFSLLLTSTGGEVQLGGYKPQSVQTGTSITYAPVTTPCCDNQVTWQVSVTEIRIASSAASSRIIYTAPTRAQANMVTIVDSGISCTLLPSSVASGTSNNVNVYQQAAAFLASNPDSTLYFKIGGVEFAVPVSGNCMLPSGSNELGLGDPFFREFLVIHDLSNRDSPRMGFARRSNTYVPPTTTTSSLLRRGVASSVDDVREVFKQMQDESPSYEQNNSITTLPLVKVRSNNNNNYRKKNIMVDGVPVTTPDKLVYYTSVSAGTPRQSPFIVQVDTGSTVMAIFTEPGSPTPAWEKALFALGMIAIFALIVAGVIIYFKRRNAKRAGDSSSAEWK